MSGKIWLYVLVPSNAVRAAIRRCNPGGLLLMDEAMVLADEFPDLDTIGRSQATFSDNIVLPADDKSCHDYGKQLAGIMFARFWRPNIRAWMGPNEMNPKTPEQARRYGAFDAGVAEMVHERRRVYIKGNWATGNPEAAEVVAYEQSYREHYQGYYADGSHVILGYHGYTDGDDDPRWRERRPWDIWRPALRAAGLEMPPVIMTEAGFDNAVQDANGYRHNWDSEHYATYLRALPRLAQECRAFCVFCAGATEDWAARGFEILGDDTVLAAIAEVNRQEDEPMPTPTPTTDLAHEIWDLAWRWPELPPTAGYNPNTAIAAYRSQHGMVGLPMSNEYTRDTWPVVIRPFSDGSVTLSRKDDWKTAVAFSEAEVRSALSGPLA